MRVWESQWPGAMPSLGSVVQTVLQDSKQPRRSFLIHGFNHGWQSNGNLLKEKEKSVCVCVCVCVCLSGGGVGSKSSSRLSAPERDFENRLFRDDALENATEQICL